MTDDNSVGALARDPAGRRVPGMRAWSPAAWSLPAAGAGIGLGILLHGSDASWVAAVTQVAAAFGQAWVAVLRAIVLPVVITQTFAAIVGARRDAAVGGLAARTALFFLLMLIGAGLLTLLIATPIVRLYPVDAETVAALRAGTSIPAAALEASRASQASTGNWLEAFIPRNIFQAAANGEILPVLLFTVFFGLAIAQLPPERREPFGEISRSLADAMMILIRWVLQALPLALFVLCFVLAREAGIGLTGAIAAFVLIVSATVLVFVGLLYPFTAVLARIPLRRFARAAAPSQLVAMTTRSSLASLPAMVQGVRDRLGLPIAATGFVLPLAVSTFKLNRAISPTVKLLFLAHVFAIPLGPAQLAVFLATVIVVSFGIAGIPDSAMYSNLPAYLAAGLPIEGVVILASVDSFADVFKTLLNVTADMSAAAILSRGSNGGSPSAA